MTWLRRLFDALEPPLSSDAMSFVARRSAEEALAHERATEALAASPFAPRFFRVENNRSRLQGYSLEQELGKR